MPLPALVLLALGASSGLDAAQRGSLPPSGAPLSVTGFLPARNALSVPRSSAIAIRFSEPVDVTSLAPPDFHVLGRWSGITPGALYAAADGRTVAFVPEQPFSPGETVFVTLSRSVRAVSGATLEQGFAWSFWTAARPGSSSFSHVSTLVPGNTPYGGYGGDIDQDEDLDLCIPNENTSDVSVFLNDGTGTFAGPTNFAAGFHCSPSEAADLDFDGDLDLVVSNIVDNDVSVLLGNGDGTFDPQVRYDTGSQPRGLALLDADGDGDMDAVTANRGSSDVSLLLNQGDGTFAPEVRFQGGVGGETGVAAADMDNDGIFDLVLVGFSSSSFSVLLGDGQGGFQLHDSGPIGASPWMAVAGDMNGDGWNDVGAILSGGSSAAVAMNDLTGGLATPASTYPAGGFPIALDFGDLDGDGDLDLSTSSFSSGFFRFYFNDGAGQLGSPLTLPAIDAGSCTILHDFDGDGDLDVTAIDEIADRVLLYRQDG